MVEQDAGQFLSQRRSPSTGMILCVVLVGLIAALDLRIPKVNLSMLYVFPLIIFAQTQRRGGILRLGVALVLLTYACFGLKYRLDIQSDYHWLWHHFGLLNRSFVAGSLLITTLLLHVYRRFRAYLEDRHSGQFSPSDTDEFLYEQIFRAFEGFLGVGICIVMALACFAVDVITPPDVNIAILYAIPLVIAALARNRLLIWILVPVLEAASYFGFAMGPAAVQGVNLPWIITNRWLAAGSLVIIAFFLHWMITRQRKQDPV